MAEKISQYLTIALLLSLGFGQLMRLDSQIGPLYIHDLLVCTILLLNIRHIKKIILDFISLRLFLLGLVLGYIRALTLYPLAELVVPLLYALRLLCYLSVFFVLRHTRPTLDKRLYAASGLICAIIGLAQYLLLPDLRLYQHLGWDDHLNRLTFPHYDPTFTGVMLALYALSVSNLGIRVLSPLALLLTYSRSVWLSLATTLLFTLKNKLLYLAILIALVIAILLLPRRFGEGNNLLRTYSITSRIRSDWGYAKQLGTDLAVGRGFNTFVLNRAGSLLPQHASGPNNSYLYLLATTGVLGLLGWLQFLRKNFANEISKPLLIFIMVASLFNNVLFYPFALLYLFLWQAKVRT